MLFALLFAACEPDMILQYPEIPPTGVYVRVKSWHSFDYVTVISNEDTLKYNKNEIIGWKFKKFETAYTDISATYTWNDSIITVKPYDTFEKLENGYYSLILSYGIDGKGNEYFLSNLRKDN